MLRTTGFVLGSVSLGVGCSERSGSAEAAAFRIDSDPALVIRAVYGAGSNSGARWNSDFVELFNRSSGPASLSGLSLQYASATGTGNLGSGSQLTLLSDVTLSPGQSYLVQASPGQTGAALPDADLVESISFSATAGKLALARTTTSLECNGKSTPCPISAVDLIIDLVGYGGADYFEGSAAPAASANAAIERRDGGCRDSNDNGADFVSVTSEPRNSLATPSPCPVSGGGGAGGSGNASGGAGGSGNASGGAGGSGNASGGAESASGGSGNAAGSNSGGTGAGTGGSGEGGGGGTNTPGTIRIHQIQGAAHRAPLSGEHVENVPGIVTFVQKNGFFLQEPEADDDPRTSEAVFVFTSSVPTVEVADSILVSGTVTEYRPGCSNCSASSSAYPNLTTTELGQPTVTVLAHGVSLPPAVLIGAGGRLPPSEVIEDDAAGDVEVSEGVFDPEHDGLDFYESLEGMRVELRNAVVVGPSDEYGEVPVLPGDGAGLGLRTARGGIIARASDMNPERVFLSGSALPQLKVGDAFVGSVFGVIDYSYANFKFVLTEALPELVPSELTRESSELGAPYSNQLSVASFNVENLDPSDPDQKFATLSDYIVHHLDSPDLISVEEVQDDTGATNDGTVTAERTLAKLVNAIQSAGGPSYEYRSIDPVNGADGGESGGNIRVVFLFRSDRGLKFVERPAENPATTANSVVEGAAGPQLAFSPGRIDPSNPAFANSRKPLSGEFCFNGQELFVIANHFNSKGGDQPLFGRFQPPQLSSEARRVEQARVVADFASQILARDAAAKLIVLGDLNDFEFSPPLSELKKAGLSALIETLPENERYTYVYQGNSQALDQMLVSDSLRSASSGFDVVHVNAEFFDQVSDHDPSIARFTLGPSSDGSAIGSLKCLARQGDLTHRLEPIRDALAAKKRAKVHRLP